MHPVIVEFYLQPVFGIDGMILIFRFDLVEDGRHIDSLPQLDLVLGDKIIRILGPEGLHPVLMMRQGTQEKPDADQRIPAIMQVRNDDPAIAFSSDHGIHRLHRIDDIDFSHRRREILPAMADA